MSRRKDRERILAQKRLNPNYVGFRGYDREPARTGSTPMTSLVCSVCGRKRNVPVGVAQEQGDSFVCSSCAEEQESPAAPEADASDPDATQPDESEVSEERES